MFSQVLILERNICDFVHSMLLINVLNFKDIVAQTSRCSYDVHILDIVGSLMVGATIVIVHPSGTLDFHYLSVLLEQKKVTSLDAVPSWYRRFIDFVQEYRDSKTMLTMRTVITGGT